MSRIAPLGHQTDEIFANTDSKAAKKIEELRLEKRKAELSDISVLCQSEVFKRWFKRTFNLHGGCFNNGLKTDAGQAHGMTLYSICADLARVDEGKEFVAEIMTEHFINLNSDKGENK